MNTPSVSDTETAMLKRSNWTGKCSRFLLSVAVIIGLVGCAGGTQGSPAPSATPGHYDFSGVKSVKHNGVDMDPAAALDATSRGYAEVLEKIQTEANPIGGSVRFVLPDHDRLRVLAVQRAKQPGGGAVEFFAELERLELHLFADVVARSHLFTSVTVAEQNNTVAPDPVGADYLIWFQVGSVGANNTGPWIGRWQMKRAGAAVVDAVGIDPGTPAGPVRLESFVKSVRLAVAHQNGGSVMATSNGVHRAIRGGTGIVIDAQGHVLTNNHVIANCPDLRITDTNGTSGTASLIAADAANDLALLKTERRWPAWASFRDSHGLRPGEPLVVTGFPLAGVVSPEMAVTTGSLTALAGGRGDTRQLQFSAPIQPGNSGGPVLDETGKVVGIASSMLNGLVVAAATGALPQNVNFAIKTNTAREFVDANHVALDDGPGRGTMSAASIGDLARKFTVKIECWR